jgi:hypothetical protein
MVQQSRKGDLGIGHGQHSTGTLGWRQSGEITNEQSRFALGSERDGQWTKENRDLSSVGLVRGRDVADETHLVTPQHLATQQPGEFSAGAGGPKFHEWPAAA